ncbi:hypothetical protein SEMRO_183_G079540.1 [Seminavis robusta]|uniref:Uncharacterized protein n=1 Tax=Seminavis robusta TaxID=568900 RepID=A0A9N8DIW6_9STRA|nr:hypothetical protein SEMRO_183_G079540.1 [Seminavis robusta]|eukprot:Sro183_g079540.1 n/a (403) ;mRNA; r:3609-4906
MTNSFSKPMTAEQERTLQKSSLMPYPVVQDATERKIENFKYAMGAQSGYFSHWLLRRAGPPADMIAHVMGYAKTVADLALSHEQQGALYRKCLTDTALTAYDKAVTKYRASIAAVPAQGAEPARMAIDFNIEQCLKAFIGSRTTEVARYNHVEGLKVQRKPRKVECHEWEDNYLVAVEAANWLRGTHPIPDGAPLLRHYLDSYPVAWVTEYEKICGKTLDDKEIGNITAFMHDRAVEADSAARRNQHKQKSTVTKGKSTSRTAKHYKGSNSSRNSSSGTKGNFNRISDDTPCPVHPESTHTWGECRTNAYGSYKRNNNNNSRAARPKTNATTGSGNKKNDEQYALDETSPGFQNSNNGGGSEVRFDPTFSCIEDDNIAIAWKALYEDKPEYARVAFATRKRF